MYHYKRRISAFRNPKSFIIPYETQVPTKNGFEKVTGTLITSSAFQPSPWEVVEFTNEVISFSFASIQTNQLVEQIVSCSIDPVTELKTYQIEWYPRGV